MNTPTPRMKEAWDRSSRTADGFYSTKISMDAFASSCYKEGCKLEFELADMTKQRDRLIDRIAELEEDWNEAREEIKMMGIRHAAAEMLRTNNMQDVTEQLDELAEDRRKWIEFAERGLMKIDAQSERIRYLEGATNHASGTPLTKAIEQRDELAEALKDYMRCANKIATYHGGTRSEVESFIFAENQADRAIEALQSLTPTQTQTKQTK
jgi:hypothetical protein